MILDSEIYPYRSWVEAGKCGRQPLKDLENWVKGQTFHKYGIKAYDKGPTIEEALQRMHDFPGILEFKSEFEGGYVQFSVKARQAGDIYSYCYSRPHWTPEDASYAVLTSIEEYERKIYEETVPLGFS